MFKGEEYLMDFAPVDELIEYCRELEGLVYDKKIEDNYSKDHILKSMLEDILESCVDMEKTIETNKRYPELTKKVDPESLIKFLKNYIIDMDRKNKLGLLN